MAIPSKKAPKISIIIVNYQTDKLVLELLRGLGEDSDWEIIVVDNSPHETLRSTLKKKHSRTTYYFTGKNLGFAGGNNFGIRRSHGEWILLLNSDTLSSKHDVKKFLDLTKNSDYLVATCRLTSPSGKIQNNIGVFDSWYMNPVSWLLARPRFLNCSEIVDARAVDLATGACMLINRSVFDRVGLLDEKNYFMYFEDIDFCYRLYLAKIPILYVTEVTIVHLDGSSSNLDLNQKSLNYTRGLDTYINKNRGLVVKLLNRYLKFFK